MRKGVFSSIALFITGAGLALAEAPGVPATPALPATTPLPATAVLPVAAPSPATVGLPAPPKPATPLPATAPLSAAPTDPCDCCCCCPPQCCKSTCFWFNAEYLMWWTKNQPLPTAVLSTGPLDNPNSAILIGGGNPIDQHWRMGGRYTFGAYLDGNQRLGIEGNYFFLAKRTDSRVVNSSGAPDSFVTGNPQAILGPNGQTTENLFFLANPPRFSSSTTLDMSTSLQGYEVNGLFNVIATDGCHIGLIAGYRYLDLKEELKLRSLSPAIPPEPVDNFNILDQFGTRNQFYGGQIGVRAQVNSGVFFLNSAAKIALGNMLQEVNVGGVFQENFGNVQTVSPGGAYSAPTNLGRHTRDRLAYIPEVTFNVGANLTNNLSAFVGYNFLWINNVLRPGDQIDRVLNPTQFPGPIVGPARPTVPFNDSNFWVQGINFGIQLRF